jgi:hypothetical protein
MTEQVGMALIISLPGKAVSIDALEVRKARRPARTRRSA